jgi:hypothetical protein
MARFNEILTGRHNRALQKLFSMKGGPPAPQLASEISASIPMFHGAENRYLEAWMRFSFSVGVAPVAGQLGTARLRNPAASNVVAVFERIVATNNVALPDQPQLEHQSSGADLAIVAFTQQMRWDPRGSQQTVLIASVNTAGSPAVAFLLKELGNFPANNTHQFINDDSQQLTLLPGDALQVQSNVVNQTLFVSFLWRERFLEDSERT